MILLGRVTGSMALESVLKQQGLNINEVKLKQTYQIPKMGTSGLRKEQQVYNRDHFLEQFIQGVADHFNSLDNQFIESKNRTIILGGDPRLGNKERIYRAAEILTANGFKVLLASQDSVASTPAMSHAIRKTGALAGLVFTASHNPFTDVGIKINDHKGAPALEDIVNGVFEHQNKGLTHFKQTDFESAKAQGLIQDIDTVQLYTQLMDQIFNFKEMKEDLKKWEQEKGAPFEIALDDMGGATGIYSEEIFVNQLGLSPKLLRTKPDPYLGGPEDWVHPNHPEPDFDFIPELIKLNQSGRYNLVSASDSDGDRRIDGGNGFWLESADEFAVFAKYSDLINIQNLFPDKRIVFAWSAVTAPTIGLMSDYLSKKFGKLGYQVTTLQTATGFKWIAEYGNLGVEESNGVGNPWLTEKDSMFSKLFLMKIMLKTGKTAQELMEEIWKEFGRIYFTRGEVSAKPSADPEKEKELYEQQAKALEAEKEKLDQTIKNAVSNTSILGQKFGDLTLENVQAWDYVDLTGKTRDKAAAYEFNFSDGVTVKARFSGTSSGGYTLRVYVTKFDKKYDLEKKVITSPAKVAFDELLKHLGFTEQETKAWTDANQPDPYQ